MAGGYTPYGALNAMYPYATYGPNAALQMALAQYSGQNALAQQAMQSNASMSNAATAAGASVAGAQIGAQGQLDAQYIQSIATLQGLDASIKADLIRAAGGDQNDINKLNATLQMQAGIANQNMAWNIAQGRGSGKLFDNFAVMAYLGGEGGPPDSLGALNGLPSPWVTAPTAQFTPYGAAPNVNMSLPRGSVGNGGWSGGGGGGFAVPGAGDLGAMYQGALGNFANWANPNGNALEFGTPPPPVATNPYAAPVIGGNAPGGGNYTYDQQIIDANSANRIALDGGLGALNAAIYGNNTGAAKGATISLGKNDAVQVGEGVNNEGVRAGTAEIMKPVGTNSMRVMPQVAPGVELYRDPVTRDTYDATGARSAAWGDTFGFDPNQTQGDPTDGSPWDYGSGGAYSTFGDLTGMNAIRGARNAGFLKTPLQKDTEARTAAQAVIDSPAPPPTATDNANTSTNTYDAGLTPPGALTPGGPTVSSLPFFQSLMSGNVGPAWNGNIQRPTAPWLGINQGVPLPFERSSTFHQSNPANQAAMMQLWQALGIPPETAMYWIRASTPGERFNPIQSLGF